MMNHSVQQCCQQILISPPIVDNIAMTRKRYFLGNEKRGRVQAFYMRTPTIAKYRGAIDAYRTLRVFKQIFEVMKICKENGGYITKGEFIAILRQDLDTANPNKQELDHFNTEIYKFRRWLGALAGILVYVTHERLNEKDFKGMEWIYRPIRNKTEYKKVRQHIEVTHAGLEQRNAENLELLSMTQKQIENRIKEVAEQLDLEAQGY
jgi:hypothetical protein